MNKYMVDFGLAETLEDTLEAIKRKIEIIPEKQWIIGWGWDKNRCKFEPHKKYLDELTASHPVALDSKDGHCLWCNTMALNSSGIDHPSGIFFENDMTVIKKNIQKPPMDTCIKYVKEGIKDAHKSGLTGVHLCEGTFEFSIYQELYRRKELDFRISWHFPLDKLDDMINLQLQSGFGNEFLRIGSVKIFMDGSLGSQTAYMFEPYEGLDHRGRILMDEENLFHIIKKANKNGISWAIHAIGDRANHIVLNAFQRVEKNPFLRNRIEHAQIINYGDIKRFSENNIIASVQPIHISGDVLLGEKYLGKRSSSAYPFKSLLNNGTKLIFGSDTPVEHFSPFRGIYSALYRKYLNNPNEPSWHPEEAIDLEDAIKAYTSDAAFSSYEENLKGEISPGKLADFIILDRNILEIPPEEIINTSVDMTIIGGKIVLGKD